jgi:hypothetical protein
MADWDRDTAWRQGCVLPKDACAALGLHSADVQRQIIAVIASHDCDLTQDPDQEPEVEIIVGCVVERIDGNFTHAKNPRKLQLEFVGTQGLIGEFVATAKQRVKKGVLLSDFEPDPDFQLTKESRNIFQLWLASRYRRSAFPDEFDRRLKDESGLAGKIAKILKRHGTHLTGIFFDVDGGEDNRRVGPDDTYQLRIFLLYPLDLILPETDREYQVREKAAWMAAAEINQAFDEKLFKPMEKWQYIELEPCFVLSEEMLSYHQFKQLKRWRFEHISLASLPQQDVLAE